MFCLKLGVNQFNRIFKMDDANGGGFQTYTGNFTFPANPIGCDSKFGYLMVFSANPTAVKIGEFNTGQIIIDWQNATLIGDANSNADLRLGTFLVNTL